MSVLIINTNTVAYCEELPQEDNSNIPVVDIKPNVFSPKTEREIKSHITTYNLTSFNY